MFRWAVAGLALFSVGMAAGGLVHQQLTASSAVVGRFQDRAVASARPASAEKAVAAATSAIELSATSAPAAAQAADEEPLASEGTARPSAGEVIIAAVKPDQQAQTRWAAPVQTTMVKMAQIRSTNSTLQDNPIVRRELTREIQQELYRSGCQSVAITGKWDRLTVKAAAQFVANRNAVLPADRPDVILLSLLRSYHSGKCGKSQEVASTAPTLVAPTAPSSVGGSFARRAQQSVGAVAGPVARQFARVPAKRITRRRKTPVVARTSRKKPRSWRHKVHYGNGSDY